MCFFLNLFCYIYNKELKGWYKTLLYFLIKQHITGWNSSKDQISKGNIIFNLIYWPWNALCCIFFSIRHIAESSNEIQNTKHSTHCKADSTRWIFNQNIKDPLKLNLQRRAAVGQLFILESAMSADVVWQNNRFPPLLLWCLQVSVLPTNAGRLAIFSCDGVWLVCSGRTDFCFERTPNFIIW